MLTLQASTSRNRIGSPYLEEPDPCLRWVLSLTCHLSTTCRELQLEGTKPSTEAEEQRHGADLQCLIVLDWLAVEDR